MSRRGSLGDQFARNGYVAANILNDYPQIKRLGESVNALPHEQWLYIVKNHRLEQDFRPDQTLLAAKHYEIARQDYDEGKFTFAFSRIVANDEAMTLPVIQEIYALFATELKALAARVSGRKLEKMSVFYLTRFDKGDFLTRHCDSGNSVGIVLNLSLNWRPEHGGLTVMLPDEGGLAGTTYMPALGNLLVFDVCERKVLHFVSEVTANQAHKRISVVARYD